MLRRHTLRDAGITLIEMMIVVAIVAVLAAIAVPNLSSFFVENRLATGANEFTTALNFARSEAIRRGSNVVVQRAPGGSTPWDWTKGWQATDVSSGQVIRVWPPLSDPMTLYMANATQLDISFNPAGGVDTVSTFRTFVLCHGSVIATASNQSRSRAVVVNSSGRVQLAPTNANGQPLKPDSSQPLTNPPVAVTSCTNP